MTSREFAADCVPLRNRALAFPSRESVFRDGFLPASLASVLRYRARQAEGFTARAAVRVTALSRALFTAWPAMSPQDEQRG
jgi:hypothetical protein